jgi:hypothetical protein
MNALKVSAQFAAFVWYSEMKQGAASRAEAAGFARENWVAFLPSAHEGLGRLLIRVARQPVARRGRGPRHARRPSKRPIGTMAEAS